jgi:alkylation response protein AidB-like acyl-CoA dehydrogenase
MTATPETFDAATANGSAQPEADTTMQWGLTPEQEAIRALAREVSEREFREHALDWERTGEFPWRNLKILAETGLLGAAIPEVYGGAGGSWLDAALILEQIGRCCYVTAMAALGELGVQTRAIVSYGTDEQKQKYLPKIASGEIRLQAFGVTEPTTGSDTTKLKTRAERRGDRYVITGQKVWTSLAHIADWCFVLARTDPGSTRHRGLSYLLVPMDQPGIEVRPIPQITGTSEFNEVFFDGAVTGVENRVGDEGDGWRVAMGTLAFERGVATLGQQIGFERELDAVVVAGPAGLLVDGAPYELTDAQRLFLFTRADTIYGGSNEVQRTIIAERMLGLPR